MASNDLEIRLDRSVPAQKLPMFERYAGLEDALVVTVDEPHLSVSLLMDDNLVSVSPRWDAACDYGISAETDKSGVPAFDEYTHGSISADPGILNCDLCVGRNNFLVERSGSLARNFRNGEAVIGTAIRSKAKVSAYLKVDLKP